MYGSTRVKMGTLNISIYYDKFLVTVKCYYLLCRTIVPDKIMLCKKANVIFFIFIQETNNWSESIVNNLESSSHAHRYISAITIIYCLYKLHQCKCCADPNIVRSLLRMIEMKKELDLIFLFKVYTDGIR